MARRSTIMPAVARKDSVDTVNTVHMAIGDLDAMDGIACDAEPTVTSTNEGSSTVFANGTGIVRVDDAVTSHTFPGCATHAPPLSAGSPNVFVEGKAMGRVDDTYGCGAQITSGSGNVFANGN